MTLPKTTTHQQQSPTTVATTAETPAVAAKVAVVLHLLLVAAALLALVPFLTTVAHASGQPVSATGYFLAQLFGELSLLAAVGLSTRRTQRN